MTDTTTTKIADAYQDYLDAIANAATLVPIIIKPESFGVTQRIEASARASEIGHGLLMEVHSAHTEFYASPRVPVGKVEIWAPPGYKERLVYVRTLNAPDEVWAEEPFSEAFTAWAKRVHESQDSRHITSKDANA